MGHGSPLYTTVVDGPLPHHKESTPSISQNIEAYLRGTTSQNPVLKPTPAAAQPQPLQPYRAPPGYDVQPSAAAGAGAKDKNLQQELSYTRLKLEMLKNEASAAKDVSNRYHAHEVTQLKATISQLRAENASLQARVSRGGPVSSSDRLVPGDDDLEASQILLPKTVARKSSLSIVGGYDPSQKDEQPIVNAAEQEEDQWDGSSEEIQWVTTPEEEVQWAEAQVKEMEKEERSLSVE